MIAEEINPGDTAWAVNQQRIARKYNGVTADRVVTKAKIYASCGKDWPQFTAAITHFIAAYEDRDNLPVLQKNAGFILAHSSDKNELASALDWWKYCLEKAPGNAGYAETATGLQQKIAHLQ